MKRRRPTPSRTELIARLHRGLRPKLVPDQLLDLGLVHAANLDAIANGRGDEGLLRDAVGSVLTWSKVAELLHQQGVVTDEACTLMTQQTEMAKRLVERFGRTGRVAFDGPDYQLAKEGLLVMDELARIVDRPTAIVAAEWSELRLEQMEAAGEKRLRAREAIERKAA
jgi:hypothetical protein